MAAGLARAARAGMAAGSPLSPMVALWGLSAFLPLFFFFFLKEEPGSPKQGWLCFNGIKGEEAAAFGCYQSQQRRDQSCRGLVAAGESRSSWARCAQEVTVAVVNLYINSWPLVDLRLIVL